MARPQDKCRTCHHRACSVSEWLGMWVSRFRQLWVWGLASLWIDYRWQWWKLGVRWVLRYLLQTRHSCYAHHSLLYQISCSTWAVELGLFLAGKSKPPMSELLKVKNSVFFSVSLEPGHVLDMKEGHCTDFPFLPENGRYSFSSSRTLFIETLICLAPTVCYIS